MTSAKPFSAEELAEKRARHPALSEALEDLGSDDMRWLATLAASYHEIASLKSRLVDAPDVGEIRKRAESATEGPWEVHFDALVRTDIPSLCDALAKRDAEIGSMQAEVDGVHELRNDLAEANEKLRIALSWEDVSVDEWTGAINDAFPTRSGSHDEYAVAMQMVGNRKSKGELVALVNWLLVRIRLAKEDGGGWVEQLAMVNAERVAKTEECARMRLALELIAGTNGTECAHPRAVADVALTPAEKEPACPRLASSAAECDECEARDDGSRCACPCHKVADVTEAGREAARNDETGRR